MFELPTKNAVLSVADTPEFEEAAALLTPSGREVRRAAPKPATAGKGPYRLWEPNAFMLKVLPDLHRGRALDLGCGSGRDAVALAGTGFEVLACDRLPEALEMGRQLAARYLVGPADSQVPNRWLNRDLEADGLPTGRYDLIVSFRYLHRPILESIADSLEPGGSLLVETFTEVHRERYGKPSSDAHILRLGELPELVPGLEVRGFEEAWHGKAHTARIWAVRG